MSECIFCKIAANELSCYKVYEDASCLAFLDIKPVTSGHVLVIPKDHYKDMTETPEALIAHIFSVAKDLMVTLKEKLAADFVVLSVVGQDVSHFHLHLIPRKLGDGLSNFWPTMTCGESEMNEVLNKIVN
ncbi:MAG: HIT family protein [bacterium]